MFDIDVQTILDGSTASIITLYTGCVACQESRILGKFEKHV